MQWSSCFRKILMHALSVWLFGVKKKRKESVNIQRSWIFCVWIMRVQRNLFQQWAVLFSSLRSLASAESWFVQSPHAGPHNRATHTMTQWSLCGLDQGPVTEGRRENPPKRDWCLCPYRCPSSSPSLSVHPSPAESRSLSVTPPCPSFTITNPI